MPGIILAARGRITTHFGEDIGRGFPHRGIDQGHGDGNAVDLEIRAPAAGKVIAVGRDGTYGLRIIILHDDFTVSLLAHHARQFVKVGDRVEQRQLIAEMGNTGTVYVHNHQEYRDKFGGQLDPLKHLSTVAASVSLSVALPEPLAPELLGDIMAAPSLFHLVTTDGNQAFICQGIANQEIISDAFCLALEKGYGIKRVQVNEYDWNAISSTWGKDLGALTSAISGKVTGASLTAADIARAVADEQHARLAQ